MERQPAIAAVLAGGAGRRLGGGKPLAELLGRPLIAYPLAAASDAGLEAIVVAKPDTSLPPLAERVVREPPEPRHPLAGFLAALADAAARRPPAAAIVAVGCDMPFVEPGLLRWLAALDGAVALRVDGRIQPLPARVPAAAAPTLASALGQERPLREALAALAPRIVDERELAAFGSPARMCASVNDAVGLERAATWLASGAGA